MKSNQFESLAKVTWHAEDVQTLKPNWSLEKCNEWLEDNERHISDRLIELGWEVIDALLITESD
jgi:hypothetical protein